MTESEVLEKLPKTITHKQDGAIELKVMDHGDKKEIYYLSKGNSSSLGTYGKDWEEAFNNVLQKLKSENYITPKKMDLINFINKKTKEDSPVGTFASDLLRDADFNILKTEAEQLEHINDLYLDRLQSQARDAFLKDLKSK